MNDFASGPEKATDDQLWMGWVWFEYHSRQRIEILKFYVAAYGAMIATAAGFVQTSYPFVSAALSVAAILLSIVFWQVDRRSLQLVQIGELILSGRWIEIGFSEQRNPIGLAQIKHADGVRYKYAFLMLFAGSALLAFILFVSAVYKAYQPN